MATKFTELVEDATVEAADEFLIRNAADGTFKKTTADKIKTFIGATVSAAWGSITGTLSNQTDLQNELNLKKNDSMNTDKLLGRGTFDPGVIEEITLGTNLSFDGTTLNAAGGGGVWGAITGTLSDQTDLQGELDDKENTLGFTPEDVANKDTDGTLAADSDTLYASQKATKTYVDTSIGAIPSVADASTTVKGISKLSTAPVSATDPIAVGDNDSRNSDARTPLAHSHPQSDVTDLVTDLDLKTDKLIVANRQTASYILVLSDADKLVEMNLAGANNLTVPPNSDVAFEIGAQIILSQYGAGQTTIVAGSGVTLRSDTAKLKITSQYSSATLIKIATDEWYVFGNLAA